MRKTAQVLVLVLLIVLLLPSMAHASDLGTRVLREGMQGEDVRTLQGLLRNIGYFSTEPTGFFGPITRTAVTNFQRAYRLTADGVAGLDTIHTLRFENGIAARTFAYARLLRRGMQGGDVSNLQEVLKRLGHMDTAIQSTGFFGVQTEAAVQRFQRNANLTADGIVNQTTAQAINAALSKLNGSSSPSNQTYTVQQGDTLWSIAQRFGTTVSQLQQTNGLTSSVIFPGQRLTIPNGSQPAAPSVTYKNYTVRSGDTIWSIAYNHGLRDIEILKANNFTANTPIFAGQVIRIPVFHIPVKPTPGPQFGELLDWWTEAQYVMKFNVPFTIIDFETGTRFQAIRTFGANHADCEPLTARDTAIMLSLWDKYHTSYWTERAVLIEIEGRRLAASMSAMLHAGLDAHPAGINVHNRSGGYGYGINLDAIKGNNADGHFDIHFTNSTRHSDGTVSPRHQANIRRAAGLQ